MDRDNILSKSNSLTSLRSNTHSHNKYKKYISSKSNNISSKKRSSKYNNNALSYSFRKPSKSPSLSSNKRSLSAPRSRDNSINSRGSRGRSPNRKRFDPTAWAKERQKKIYQAKQKRNTFGYHSKSRSPSINNKRYSRSASPNLQRILQNNNNYNNKYTSSLRNNNRSRSNSKKKLKRKSNINRNSNGNIDKPPLLINESDNDNINTDSDETSFNAKKEIENIDARLNALQNFLKAAKAKD
mmetsp:Transcript_12248/g.15273  ORF Transcript_12248/g.15273 Transcript_12248/m.15273 type:complete len:241 (+) Transcript_12248:60-782(+)